MLPDMMTFNIASVAFCVALDELILLPVSNSIRWIDAIQSFEGKEGGEEQGLFSVHCGNSSGNDTVCPFGASIPQKTPPRPIALRVSQRTPQIAL